MRPSLSFLTSTSGLAPAVPTATGAHRLDVLGFHRGQRAIYFVENVAVRGTALPGDGLPMLFVMHLGGESPGRLATAISWYQGQGTTDDAAGFRRRLAALEDELVPLIPRDPDDWSLSTRVLQHRALRLPDGQPAIRKFALSLEVVPVMEAPPSAQSARIGITSVTAYLRPRAVLDGVWAIPDQSLAVARVAYTGVPSDAGHAKHTAVLVRNPA
jgi:hypothetical protein